MQFLLLLLLLLLATRLPRSISPPADRLADSFILALHHPPPV